MLWNYVDTADSLKMCSKLDSLADTLYFHLDRSKEFWGQQPSINGVIQPQFFVSNMGFSSLGFAGCILGNDYYIDYAKEMLFEYDIPYLLKHQYGFLDFITTNSNYIGEGLTYFGGNNYSFINVFLTAYLRMYGENLYNSDIIKNTMSNVVNMIRPDMKQLTLDDTYSHYNPGLNNIFMEEFVQGLWEYYYNNNSEADNSIRWYFNEFKNRYGTTSRQYPILRHWNSSYQAVFSYNPNKSICILDDPDYYIPEIITNGSYTDEELTVFRNGIITQNDFENSIQMYINYDNDLDPSWHEDGDQTSFQLFAFGKYLLIDPGYKSGSKAKQWIGSSYGHNLIIVNPDSSNEAEHLEYNYQSGGGGHALSEKEPEKRRLLSPSYVQNHPETVYAAPNPAYKEHFITNQNIEELKIYMNYVQDPNEDDTVRVERDFYFIDKEYFVIIVNLENIGEGYSNIFWNTLHFAPYLNDDINLDTFEDGTFILDADDNISLFGAIGASSQFYTGVDHEMPFGCYYDNFNHRYEHSRLKAVTETVNTKYITILVPSESATNPITNIIDGDSYYAIEVYDAAKTPTEKSYYAVSDSLLDVSFIDIDINSDAGFVGLTYRPGYQFATKITQFIMAEGDSLLYNDSTIVQCSNINEIIADYSGTELSVIVKSDDEYPQYKILRQGVDPEDFSSIGVVDQGNGSSNIEHLSYDNNYFYVNWYDFSTSPVYLTTSISVPEENCLEIGNNVTVNCMNTDVSIEVYGDIIIGENVTFTSPSCVAWDGLYLFNSEGEYEITELTFENGIMSNESYLLDISNSEFNNAAIEQFGNKLYISQTDFDSSNVICSFSGSGGKIGDPDDVEINIDDCSFINYLGYSIYITGYDIYELSNNTITDCNGGIKLYYSGHPRKCIIYNNTIQDNIYGNGIQIFNSQADIIGNNLITGNSYGIVGANNSSISILGNETYPLQMIYDNIHEEIVVDHRSFPENITCNKIYDDNFQYGTSDQYLIRCANFEGDERDLDAQNNYWGLESLEWFEWGGDYRFDPSTAFDYIPVWDPGTPRDGDLEGAALLYAEADSLIEEEAYEEAKLLFKLIIDIYPYTEYALYSMRNLLALETTSGQDYYTLQQYLLTDPKCNIDQIHTKLSNHLANFCSIKMEQYPEAISFFEDIITNPETTLDSVYAVIDVGYTYLLMDNGGKSEYVGKIPQLKPKSIMEYRETSEDLLSMVFNLREVESNVINQDYKFVLNPNFPNPFGNSTLISFSLPLSTQKSDLKIYNIRGQMVRELIIGNKPGIDSITWDGRDNHGKIVGSGIYF